MADKSKKPSSSGADGDRKAHRDLLIRLAVVVLLAAGLAVAVVVAASAIYPRWFERNPRMVVRRIQISSSGDYWNSDRGRAELLRRLDMNDEEPLWSIDPGELRAELEDTKKFSSVQSAKVMLWMPDTLEIVLTERTPVAFLFSRSSPVVVDESGMLIKRSESMTADGDWEELPLISGLEPRFGIGERDPRLAPAVALIMEAQKDREPDSRIEIIRIDFERAYSTSGGRVEPEKMFCTFRFGRSEVECRAVFPVRNHEKFLGEYVYRLRTTLLRSRLKGEDFRDFDLTFGARVVAK